ncbi:MAG TPA: family 10 glycosylhydrolase [Candidatus Cybelea sp.]|nr:family 10 glycosylhydrolase [Candidatus Cybelea sp.]
MLQEMIKGGLLPALVFSLAGDGVLAASQGQTEGDDMPPPIQREFRGLWVATVENIDWPSQRGLDSFRQKQEMLATLDRAAALRFNVVVLQVRGNCDAFYDSKIEPWSEYLTGRMGQAPSPFYDPLQFAVAEAHKRGLELHAWFNPYRARLRDPKTPVATNHVTVQHPELVRAYGKFLWLDPSEQGTRDYSLSVIMDVVRRYDIDGVHFDDYFYPYPEKANGQDINFPDEVSWRRYREQGGKMAQADWRRENVDRFVQTVYQAIKKEKPWVKFGISPFGIWRPTHPAQITGFDAYDRLYADSRKWLTEGWLDYCAPQLYWPVEQKAQSFPVLLQWWASQNTRHRTLLAGMKVNGWKDVPDDAREVGREIELTRRQSGAVGEILWHARPLLHDAERVAEILQNQVYAASALVPPSPWLSSDTPNQPLLQAAVNAGELKLNWKSSGLAIWQWVLQKKSGGHWAAEILPGVKTSESIPAGPGGTLPETVMLFAIDRFGNISSGAIHRATP